MKRLLYITLAALPLFSAEPSAFGAGDLEAENPYGLTESEKVILTNKKKVKTLDKTISKTQLQINRLNESIEGVSSVVDGQNQRINKLQSRLLELEESLKKSYEIHKDTQERISNLEAYTKNLKKVQDKNYKRIRKILKELSSLIDSINSNYVSKDEIGNLNLTSAKSPSKHKVTSSKGLQKKDSPTLMNEAVKLFRKKKYDEAKKRFELLVDRIYKPARSNYYLGEISYYTKQYEDAVSYYKKSLSIYDKAGYVPTLLLHTAISLEKLGRKKDADKFYLALEVNYPDSKEFKIVKEKRKNQH